MENKTTNKTNPLSIADVIIRLQSLTKYDTRIAGCECCGSWVEYEEHNLGDWIKTEDVEALIRELQENGL